MTRAFASNFLLLSALILLATPARAQGEAAIHGQVLAMALRNAEVQVDAAQDEERDGILLPLVRKTQYVAAEYLEQGEQRAAKQDKRSCASQDPVLERAPDRENLLHAPDSAARRLT